MAKKSDTPQPQSPKKPKPGKAPDAPVSPQDAANDLTTNPSAGSEQALRSDPEIDKRPPPSARKSHKPV